LSYTSSSAVGNRFRIAERDDRISRATAGSNLAMNDASWAAGDDGGT
jgi:hypothetical protein